MSHPYFKYYNYPPWETIFGFPNHDLKLSLYDEALSFFSRPHFFLLYEAANFSEAD